MRYGYFVDRDGVVIDEVLVVYMPSGKSYTGQHQVEIYCHGGRQVVQLIQKECVRDGARVAEPGEFTKLAFLAGRIDLTKAEAVAEVIAANTDTSFDTARDHLLGKYHEHVVALREKLIDIIAEVEASVDYPEDEIEAAGRQNLLAAVDVIMADINELSATYQGGQIINEGFKIAIAGRPNAGKSSLFNLLLRHERALVTPTPGTTRDYLSEWIDLEGYKVNIIDTAGLRATGGAIEKAGQKSSRTVIQGAHLIVWMADLSKPGWSRHLERDLPDLGKRPILLVGNKIDAARETFSLKDQINQSEIIAISCKTNRGIKQLREAILGRIESRMPDLTSGVVVTSARHKQKLSSAVKSLRVRPQETSGR